MKKAVLFDAGGTLIRLRGTVGGVYSTVAAEHGVEVDAGLLEDRFRTSFRDMPGLCFPNASEADLPRLEREWWAILVRRVFEGVTVPTFEHFFGDLFDYFADPHSWELYGDVRSALEGLEKFGVRMGIVSNFDARLHRICEGLGISSFFEAVVVSGRAGHAKPDPRIFRIALKQLGAGAAEALHVGDSEEEDVRGARAAGMEALLIARSGGKSDTERVDDLRRVVDRLSDPS